MVKEVGELIKLEFRLTRALLNQVRANERNPDVRSGYITAIDFNRMGLTINGHSIDNLKVRAKDSRQGLRQRFKEMFKCAGGAIPVDSIVEELITSCNQAGYCAFLFFQLYNIFDKHGLKYGLKDHKVSIECSNPNFLTVKHCGDACFWDQDMKEYRFDAVLEFKLEVKKNGKGSYKDGKVTLTIPKGLKKYRANGKNLFDDINKHFADAGFLYKNTACWVILGTAAFSLAVCIVDYFFKEQKLLEPIKSVLPQDNFAKLAIAAVLTIIIVYAMFQLFKLQQDPPFSTVNEIDGIANGNITKPHIA